MENLKITGRRILLVTAHPDDESLWFYAGIKDLAKTNSLDLLCLTYNHDTERGKELLGTINNLNLTVFFGNLDDRGIKNYLSGVYPTIQKLIDNSFIINPNETYDIILTHPPHGGEKPHPHHIQAFIACLMLSSKYKLMFAFFSERKVDILKVNEHLLRLSKPKVLFFFMGYLFNMIKAGDFTIFFRELLLILKSFPMVKDHWNFRELKFYPEPAEKKLALINYNSQIDVLERYKSFVFSDVEYLYFEDG